VCISRQKNSGYKAEQVKYRGTRPLQFPPPFPSLALIHTSLSLKKRGRTASTLNTHRQASLMGVALHYTCPTSEVVHWASPWGRLQHWYVKGARATSYRKKERTLSITDFYQSFTRPNLDLWLWTDQHHSNIPRNHLYDFPFWDTSPNMTDGPQHAMKPPMGTPILTNNCMSFV